MGALKRKANASGSSFANPSFILILSILQGDVRKRVFSVESELDQGTSSRPVFLAKASWDRIDMEMAAIGTAIQNDFVLITRKLKINREI